MKLAYNLRTPISKDDSLRLAEEIWASVLKDTNIQPVRDGIVPALDPGAVWVGYNRRSSGTEIDLIVKAHHVFLVSTFQFPFFSLIAQILTEADEILRDEDVQRYFRITPDEAEGVRDTSVKVFTRHLLDSLFISQRFNFPMMLEQAIVTVANTIGRQQWEVSLRTRPQDTDIVRPPEWFLKEPDVRYAFRKFPNVPFTLLRFIDSLCRPETSFRKRLREGGSALIDPELLVEEHRELKDSYTRVKAIYKRALRFSERRRRHDPTSFNQKWSDWARRRFRHLPMSVSCHQFAPYQLAHHHLAIVYVTGPKYIEELLRKLRRKQAP